MDPLATMLTYGMPFFLHREAEAQLAAARRGEPVDPDGVVLIEGDAVYLRFDRITVEDHPHGACLRYHWKTVDVMWKCLDGIRITLDQTEFLIFTCIARRIRVPHGLHPR